MAFWFLFFFSPKMNLYLISLGILTFSCKCFKGFFGILSRQLWQVTLVFWISNTYRTEYNEFSLVSTQNLSQMTLHLGLFWKYWYIVIPKILKEVILVGKMCLCWELKYFSPGSTVASAMCRGGLIWSWRTVKRKNVSYENYEFYILQICPS